MSNFITGLQGDPIADFLVSKYEDLHYEFFNYIATLPWTNKPQYTRPTTKGKLYDGQIKALAVKLSRTLLDRDELRLTNWTDDLTPFRYPLQTRFPGVPAFIPTWYTLLDFSEVEQIFFNVAYPPATLSYHYGVSSHCWRYHLCLQNNAAFSFDLGGETKPWVEGPSGLFKFDDGLIKHGVLYDPSKVEQQPRIVAILDVKKQR